MESRQAGNADHNGLLWPSLSAAAALPIGLLVETLLASNQDAAGSAIASGIGTLVAVAVWLVALATVLWQVRRRAQTRARGMLAFVVLAFSILPAALIWPLLNSQSYTLRMHNESGTALREVTVQMSGADITFGAMQPGIYQTRHYFKVPPAGVATVSWTDAGKQSHSVAVDLADTVPTRYTDGYLDITIQADATVQASFYFPTDLSF